MVKYPRGSFPRGFLVTLQSYIEPQSPTSAFPLVVKQPCGVARLLAEVCNLPLTDMFLAVGLDLCPRCDQPASNPKYYPYCGTSHKGPDPISPLVPLACDECGTIFYRQERHIITRLGKRNYQHVWCNKQCQGQWFGREYGLAHRPEDWGKKQSHCKRGHPLQGDNLYIPQHGYRACRACAKLRHQRNSGYVPHPRLIGTGRKHNWAAVWQAHLETGFGELRLGRALGIPTQSVGNILRYYQRRGEPPAAPL